MKVKIDPYKNFIGPFQIAEFICFWAKKEKDEWGFEHTADWVHNFGEWLSGGEKYDSWLNKLCLWIESKRKRNIKVKIDRWDTWSIDDTLAHIILPMLKQLKEQKHGSPMIKMEDVPEEMRLNDYNEEWESQQCFDFYKEDNKQNIQCDIHDRWDWILDEMIFAFEHIVDDSWEDGFRTGNFDTVWTPTSFDENGKPKLYKMDEGPNHTYKCDYEGMKLVEDRIQNGLRLFGTYYQGLWS